MRPSYRARRGDATVAPLSRSAVGGTVLGMYTLGRLLQIVGLTIPPLSIISQLAGLITPGKMLQFLVVSIAVFAIGHLLQRYSGSRPG
jgi:hypothetical protein